MTGRWQNVHNDLEVIFGVEGDILNEEGEICIDIQGIIPELIILSSHPSPVYRGNLKKITEAYLKAIELNHDKITFLGHPCAKYFEDHLDIIPIVEICNRYDLPMEFNCANLVNKRTNLKNLDYMLRNVKRIYINSDAHTLNEVLTLRSEGFKYLREYGFIN
jgi:histidinol phosphatase-like PHP family hydrolase